MESQSFDNLSRLMASGTSRRTVLRGVAGGMLAAVGLRGGAAAKASKVDICHYDKGTGTYQWINVSQNARQAHLNHGDFTECDGNFEVDFNSCTCVCDPASLGCSGNYVADIGSCSCICGLAGCDDGHELDDETCQCVAVAPIDVCADKASEIGTSCGAGRECSWSLDAEKLICAHIFSGSTADGEYTGQCTTSTDCPRGGEVCVNDRFGIGHCHPL